MSKTTTVITNSSSVGPDTVSDFKVLETSPIYRIRKDRGNIVIEVSEGVVYDTIYIRPETWKEMVDYVEGTE